MARRFLRILTKIAAILALLVFIVLPVHTFKQILVVVGLFGIALYLFRISDKLDVRNVWPR